VILLCSELIRIRSKKKIAHTSRQLAVAPNRLVEDNRPLLTKQKLRQERFRQQQLDQETRNMSDNMNGNAPAYTKQKKERIRPVRSSQRNNHSQELDLDMNFVAHDQMKTSQSSERQRTYKGHLEKSMKIYDRNSEATNHSIVDLKMTSKNKREKIKGEIMSAESVALLAARRPEAKLHPAVITSKDDTSNKQRIMVSL
jgi:hypothetical protein